MLIRASAGAPPVSGKLVDPIGVTLFQASVFVFQSCNLIKWPGLPS